MAAVSYSSNAETRSMYLGKDVLGSVRSMSADTGMLEDRYEYDALGTPYQGDLSGWMNLGYTGKPYDTATGLYNYGFRDYRPVAARFTTEDPVRDGNNWFAYVNNDPVNWIDPWGLSANDNYTHYGEGPEITIYADRIKDPGNSIWGLSELGKLTTADQVDMAATIAGVTIAKTVSNQLTNASIAVGAASAIIDGIDSGIKNNSFTQGYYSAVENLVIFGAGAIVSGLVFTTLTGLSGGAGAGLAAAAAWYAGYKVSELVSNKYKSGRNNDKE